MAHSLKEQLPCRGGRVIARTINAPAGTVCREATHDLRGNDAGRSRRHRSLRKVRPGFGGTVQNWARRIGRRDYAATAVTWHSRGLLVLPCIAERILTMPEAINNAAPSADAAAEKNAADTTDAENQTPQKLREALLKTFFTGLSWTAAARGLTAVGTAARYIVFVRLLKPFDFGVIASAMLICTALSAATDPRMGQALIQQEDQIDPYLDTLFTTYFLRSLVIGLVLILFARPLGNFFHLGDAYTVFWAIVPLPILQSLQSPRLISLYRRLDFHFVTILNVSEVAASFVFGLIAVLYWRDWRGLVFSLMVGAVVRDILTYWLFPHWPRLAFNTERAKTMLSFGLVVQLRRALRVHRQAARQSDRWPSARSGRARQLPDGVSRGRDAGRGIHHLRNSGDVSDGGATAQRSPRASASLLVGGSEWSPRSGWHTPRSSSPSAARSSCGCSARPGFTR